MVFEILAVYISNCEVRRIQMISEQTKREISSVSNPLIHYHFAAVFIYYRWMLTHIVCWKYKAETTPEQRAEHLAKLRALVGVIPEIETFNVGSDILHLERSFDTGLTSTFADRAALEAYTIHPAHQEVANLGKQIAERVVSVDFVDE